MGSKIFHRCFEVDDVGISPQANPSRPPRGKKYSCFRRFTQVVIYIALKLGVDLSHTLESFTQVVIYIALKQ